MSKPKRDQLSFPPAPAGPPSVVPSDLPVGRHPSKNLKQVRDELLLEAAVITGERMKAQHAAVETNTISRHTVHTETRTIEELQALKQQGGRDPETQHLVEQAINRGLRDNHVAMGEIARGGTESIEQIRRKSLYPDKDTRSLKKKWFD